MGVRGRCSKTTPNRYHAVPTSQRSGRLSGEFREEGWWTNQNRLKRNGDSSRTMTMWVLSPRGRTTRSRQS